MAQLREIIKGVLAYLVRNSPKIVAVNKKDELAQECRSKTEVRLIGSQPSLDNIKMFYRMIQH